MQSTIDIFKTQSSKGHWISPLDGYRILTQEGCFLPDGHNLNPEGVYDIDLYGYIHNETTISEIDDSLNWFYNDKVAAPCFDSETELVAKELYNQTSVRNRFKNMTNLDIDNPILKKFLRRIFFNSSRKGYTAPCVFYGWNIAVLPAGGDIEAKDILKALNKQVCNKGVVKAEKFRTLKHQNLSCIVSNDEFNNLNQLQKDNITDATIIVYYLTKLENYPN